MKYSRQDYMNNICTHRQYYAQFVTKQIKHILDSRIGVPRLLKSKDEHLNDIPLSEWDHLAQLIDGDSLSMRVCILKEAAKQMIEEATK